MRSYIGKRLVLIFFVLWAVATIVFFMVHVTPGDIGEAILYHLYGDDAITPEALEHVREKFDLDKPITEQYLIWLGKVCRGDFGTSYFYNMPVSEVMLARIPNTILLGSIALGISLVIGLPLGIASALQHNKFFDHFVRGAVLVLSSFPGFLVAILLIVVFAIHLGWFPTSGMHGAKSIILPAITLSISGIASMARMMRTSLLDVLNQDYITVARAKGLTRGNVIYRHAIRNAIPPIITLVALQTGHILGGSVVVESIFAWPGVGGLFLNAVNSKDTPMIEGCTLLMAFGYAFFNLVADIIYTAIDPRVKQGQGGSSDDGRSRPGFIKLKLQKSQKFEEKSQTQNAVYLQVTRSVAKEVNVHE